MCKQYYCLDCCIVKVEQKVPLGVSKFPVSCHDFHCKKDAPLYSPAGETFPNKRTISNPLLSIHRGFKSMEIQDSEEDRFGGPSLPGDSPFPDCALLPVQIDLSPSQSLI